jgi:hypothetical protein
MCGVFSTQSGDDSRGGCGYRHFRVDICGGMRRVRDLVEGVLCIYLNRSSARRTSASTALGGVDLRYVDSAVIINPRILQKALF